MSLNALAADQTIYVDAHHVVECELKYRRTFSAKDERVIKIQIASDLSRMPRAHCCLNQIITYNHHRMLRVYEKVSEKYLPLPKARCASRLFTAHEVAAARTVRGQAK